MIDASVHGVALIKVGVGPVNPQEFYAVFLNGELQRSRWPDWVAADRYFRRMETIAATRREQAAARASA